MERRWSDQSKNIYEELMDMDNSEGTDNASGGRLGGGGQREKK